ncbi:MAG: hypothetical protein ACLGHC_05865 [Alphaproteobacteria bacterium]
MDIRKLALAASFLLAACGSDEDALMGEGANALTPAQVDAALGPELANQGGTAVNATSEDNALQESEAVEAAEESEPAAPARTQPRDESEEDEAPAPAEQPEAANEAEPQ